MATPGFAHYSADAVSMVFGNILADGTGDGEFLTVEFNEDAFTTTVGTDGKMIRNRILNRTGRVTLTLSAASQTNVALSTIYNLDQIGPGGAGVASLTIRDANSGQTLIHAPEAWIARPPDLSFDQTAAPRTWIFDCSRLDYFVGSYG
jgi:hypothetical protein